MQVKAPSTELAVDALRASTTYYARINVRNRDGSVHESAYIYKFTTVDPIPVSNQLGESSTRFPRALPFFRNVGGGRVKIRWSYPQNVLDSISGFGKTTNSFVNFLFQAPQFFSVTKRMIPSISGKSFASTIHNRSVYMSNICVCQFCF